MVKAQAELAAAALIAASASEAAAGWTHMKLWRVASAHATFGLGIIRLDIIGLTDMGGVGKKGL